VPAVQIDINDVASVGVVRDSPPHEIPPEAWTMAENVRFEDDSVVRENGYTQIFGTPGVAPYFPLYVSAPGQPWWLYAGLQKIYAFDGVTHTDITRAVGGNYSTTAAAQLNGTILGGIPIINNGVDKPQFWSAYSAGTKMADLTNWPATMTAKVLRAFGPYLFALNLTVGGVQKPNDVRWSHPADPGSVPGSWDITDPTKNAGEVSLPDVDSGQIVDGLPLQGRFYVYKENSCWRFRNVGGAFIFDEDAFLETIGLLSARCVAVTGDGQRHIFVGNDNIFTHDGNSARPLLDKKARRYLFNQIDVTNYGNSFIFVNPERNEAIFCYPGNGATVPNRRLTINYNTMAMTEGDVDFQAAAMGTVQTVDSETWASVAGTWDDDTLPWNASQRRKLVLCKPTATKFEQFDLGTTRDGTAFTGLIQRTSLGVVGRKRTGEWIEDFEVRKMCHRIWPKMSGGPVSIRLGGQSVPNGPVTWSAAATFDPSTQKYCDLTAEGAALAIEISGATSWKLDGYKLDLFVTGKF
jgi:hypothetical protein